MPSVTIPQRMLLLCYLLRTKELDAAPAGIMKAFFGDSHCFANIMRSFGYVVPLRVSLSSSLKNVYRSPTSFRDELAENEERLNPSSAGALICQAEKHGSLN